MAGILYHFLLIKFLMYMYISYILTAKTVYCGDLNSNMYS